MNPVDLSTNVSHLFRVVLRFVRPLLWLFFVTPWILLGLIRHVVLRFRESKRQFRLLRLATATHLICPFGHRSALNGVFECRTCGVLFAGFAFQRCPNCSTSCGYTTCEHCGMSLRNPWL